MYRANAWECTASHFVTMRGTRMLGRLTCRTAGSPKSVSCWSITLSGATLGRAARDSRRSTGRLWLRTRMRRATLSQLRWHADV